MRDPNSTKKTRRWPPQVGKRHRRDGNAAPEQAPKTEVPSPEPVHDNRASSEDGSQGRTVVVSRRSQLRAAVAKKRHEGLPVGSG